ncbi:MAG: hypothetical protein NTV25_10365 [Methanothrix sp.]|nr:hypothetical protein [Methanothrix sp.]
MASLVSRPVLDVVLGEEEGSLVVSEIKSHDSYLSKPSTPRYEIREVAFLEQENDPTGEESVSVSVLIEDILRHFRTLGVKIVSSSVVFEYLYHYPEIAKLSRDVSNLVYQYFDFKAQLLLDVRDYNDPDSAYLTLCVRVPVYDDSVMERIEKIREGYYHLLNEMTGWFLLTTDYIPTR